jgi:hypothetical protein
MRPPKDLLVRAAVGLALILGQAAQPKPLSGGVLEILALEKVALARSGAKLAPAEADRVLEASVSSVSDIRMAAAYILAYTDSPKATNALSSLASDPDHGVAGTAQFTVMRRELASLRGQDLLPAAVSRMAGAREVWTRTLLASWLGDKCGSAIVSPFLVQLQAETDKLVRAEILFQVGTRGTREQLVNARSALNESDIEHSARFIESEAQFLNALSGSPRKRATTPGFLKSLIEPPPAEKQ